MSDKPRIAEAERRFEHIAGVPFGELLDAATLDGLSVDKGGGGRAIERLLGVTSGNAALDFADGELKTFRADPDGYPVETIALNGMSDLDPLLAAPPYAASPIHPKLRRAMFVGVWRGGSDPAAWRVVTAFRLDARPGTEWYRRLEASYEQVVRGLRERLLGGLEFATVSGELLQLRVRDSRPYTPIHSVRLGRQVSDKRVGFYLRKRMIRECVDQARACS